MDGQAVMESANAEDRMIALQDELQRVMDELELTQQDRDKKVALGRDVEARLQSSQAELGFINKQLAALQQQYQEAIGQAGYYKAERDAFKLERDTLRTQLATATTTQRASSPKPAKLPNPPVFTGDARTDEISLDVWKIKMADKIGQEGIRYPDALAQLRYVFSRVGGAAQAQLELFAEESYARALRLANEHPSDSAFRSMFRILDNAFGDPDRANTARTRLAKLSQGKKTFAEHYAEFMRYAPKTGYDENSLLHMLRLQLSQELGTALSYQATELTTMDELVRLCQSLDNRQRAEQHRQRSRPASPPVAFGRPASPPVAFSCPASPPVAFGRPASPASSPATSTATGTHPGPMDTSAGKLRAKWVTPDVLSEQRAKGLCVRCGSKQHFVSQCMLLPARRPQIATARARVPEDAEVEDNEWQVEEITDSRWERRGRGQPRGIHGADGRDGPLYRSLPGEAVPTVSLMRTSLAGAQR